MHMESSNRLAIPKNALVYNSTLLVDGINLIIKADFFFIGSSWTQWSLHSSSLGMQTRSPIGVLQLTRTTSFQNLVTYKINVETANSPLQSFEDCGCSCKDRLCGPSGLGRCLRCQPLLWVWWECQLHPFWSANASWGGSRCWPKNLHPCRSWGRPRASPELLARTWPIPRCCNSWAGSLSLTTYSLCLLN